MKTCSRCGREYQDSAIFCSGDGNLLDATDVERLIGSVIAGRYRLDEKLGEGAHGVVFRATQLELGRRVAVKILHPAKVLHPSVLAGVRDVRDYWLSCVVRFQREARAAARIRHPNIVAVTDFGTAAGDLVYMVMEHVTGRSLRDIIADSGSLPVAVAVRIMHQVCYAVEAAHRQGVIHRDLKPANIVIEPVEGSGDIVKVLDFGIAKFTTVADDDLTNLTDTGVMLGTPKYMSPEQCCGGELDARSDVYSLGIVLYEMLTGTLPFTGTAMSVALQQTINTPRPPRQLNPAIPEAIERVLLTALEKNREKRQPSALAFINALEQAASDADVHTEPAANEPSLLTVPKRTRIDIALPSLDGTPGRDKVATAPPIQAAVEPGGLVATPETDTHVRAALLPIPRGMVHIPAGTFRMGSDNGLENERPIHEVWLDDYFIDATEVSNREYRAFCDATRRPYPPNPRWDHRYFTGQPDHPVLNVTWFDAEAYARWAGKRLPTEAEWEKAARGGLEGCDYPWGNAIDPSLANYDTQATCPVGTFAANGYGLHEIVGNVWEWCADWYDGSYYSTSPRESPTGPGSGSDRVVRGGSIDGTYRTLRISYRHWMQPVRRSSDVGFRCVADARKRR